MEGRDIGKITSVTGPAIHHYDAVSRDDFAVVEYVFGRQAWEAKPGGREEPAARSLVSFRDQMSVEV